MKCCICDNDINGKYYIDQWGHNICASHMDKKEVTMCTSCGAFTTEHPIADGRCMCKDCKSTVISTQHEVAECLSYVKNQLVSVGFDFGTCNVNNIPIEIVSAKKIAEIRKAPISTNNKGVTFTETQMRGTSRDDMKVVGHSHKIYMLSDQPRLEFLGIMDIPEYPTLLYAMQPCHRSKRIMTGCITEIIKWFIETCPTL